VSVGQASGHKVILNQASESVLDIDKLLDLCVIQLPKVSLHAGTDEQRAQIMQIKNSGLNLAALPLQTLHELHQGVSDELCIRNQCALLIISEVKTKNQQIFEEKV